MRAPQGPAPCHGLLLPAWPEHPQCCPIACHGLPLLPTPLPKRPHKPGGLGQGTGEEPRKGVPGPPLTKHRAQVGENWGLQPSRGFAEGAQNAACDRCNKVMMIPAELLGWRSGVKEGDWGGSVQEHLPREELDMGWELLMLCPWGQCGLGRVQETHPAVWPQYDLGPPAGSLCEYLGKQNVPVADMAVAALSPMVDSHWDPAEFSLGPSCPRSPGAEQGRAPISPPQPWSPPELCSPTALSLKGAGPRHKRWEQDSSTSQTLVVPSQELHGQQEDKNESPSPCCSLLPIKH